MANEQTKRNAEDKPGFSLFSRIRSSMTGLFEKPETEQIFNEFELELGRLQNTGKIIDREVARMRNWNLILMNTETGENAPSIMYKGRKRGLMETFNRKWIALGIAFTLYRTLLPATGQPLTRFSEEKLKFISIINQYDPKLAKKIAVLSLQENEAAAILAPLAGIMGNSEIVVAYINTHYEEMMQKIDRMRDNSLAAKLRQGIVILSNREIEEISKCIDDVRNWQYRLINDKKIGSFVGKYKIPFNVYLIIERSHLFMGGGVSRYDGEKFLGFNAHFRDKGLVDQIRGTPEIKKLMSYIEELKFFDEKSRAIQKSVQTEGNWQGFEYFYNNLRKGENYIGVVRNRFGNEKFAKILEVFERKKHEAPLDWEKELQMLGEEISQSYYYIVSSAENAFLRIFGAAINQLNSKKQSAMNELAAILAKNDDMAKIRNRFLRVLADRRNQLRQDLERERRVFENEISDFVLLMPQLDTELAKIVAIADTGNAPLEEGRILKFAQSTRRFTLAQTRAYADDATALRNGESATRAIAGSIAGTYGSLRAAITEARLEQKVELKHIDGIIAIKKLMNFIENQVNSKLANCSRHINSRLKDYVGEANAYVDSRVDARQQIKVTQFQQRQGSINTRQSGNTQQSARILKFARKDDNKNTKQQLSNAA